MILTTPTIFPAQCSLVAFYGEKPAPLQTIIRDLQAPLIDLLGDQFVPYDLLQSHATFMALERAPHLPGFVNRFYHEMRGEIRTMNFDGALAFLLSDQRFPFQVQLGGWQPDEMPFTSAGKSPYERSFSIQGDKVVLMGWCVNANGQYPDTLNRLRHDLAQFSLLHKYFRQPEAVDNDFYMRIGLLRTPLDETHRQSVEDTLRKQLAGRPPLLLDVTLADLKLAAYVDEPLTFARTRHWSLPDAALTGDFMRALFG